MLSNPALSIPTPEPFDQLTSLHGRVAVVTGGSRGIGEAIVWRLTQAGAAVIATARGKKALDEIRRRSPRRERLPSASRPTPAASKTRSA